MASRICVIQVESLRCGSRDPERRVDQTAAARRSVDPQGGRPCTGPRPPSRARLARVLCATWRRRRRERARRALSRPTSRSLRGRRDCGRERGPTRRRDAIWRLESSACRVRAGGSEAPRSGAALAAAAAFGRRRRAGCAVARARSHPGGDRCRRGRRPPAESGVRSILDDGDHAEELRRIAADRGTGPSLSA